jgi:hypothetical protein
MSDEITLGRLLRSDTATFVVGCRVEQANAPSFGALVKVPVGAEYAVYGLIYNIAISDDGIIRQLVTSQNVDEQTIADNRTARIVPLEMSVVSVGYREQGGIRHLLPPRPPLSLDMIYLCSPAELREFTLAGSFGYFRHILRAENAPVGELLAAHLEQAQQAHAAAGDGSWAQAATRELITLLRDDYPTLMGVLSALGDAQFI